MAQKIQDKITSKNRPIKVKFKQRLRAENVKIRYLALAVGLVFCSGINLQAAKAINCPDVKIIFARGSGETQDTDKSYMAFRSSLRDKLATTQLKYEFSDLKYPAVSVGGRYFVNGIGAFLSGGNGYVFGRSMNQGYRNLVALVTDPTCPQTKFVLGGYSQGAMIVDKTLKHLPPEKLIYAATFGDPKIYLPEGAGFFPAACRGENLSEYRRYVPDCQAYKGILGPYIPYRAEEFVGKVGTWCNSRDVLCSHYYSVTSHMGYVENNLYEDASKVIFDKINKAFNLNSRIASPRDTVILIDSSESMIPIINRYKAEALRLARETLDAGGRVALYDYRDVRDPYEPQLHCDFFTCDLDTIRSALDNLEIIGGGDNLESLLSASMHAMRTQQWQYGAVKSIVVLTDDGFLSPDFDEDHTTLDDVVKLSKSIDPVNFYVVTDYKKAALYDELVSRTDGKVVTDLGSFSLMVDYILDRYDSLPRVEETSPQTLPTFNLDSVERLSESSARLKFNQTGTQTMVFINDMPLGITTETELTITDLDPSYQNIVTLVPMTDTVRGEGVSIELNDGVKWDELDKLDFSDSVPQNNSDSIDSPTTAVIPKAPDTGKVKH